MARELDRPIALRFLSCEVPGAGTGAPWRPRLGACAIERHSHTELDAISNTLDRGIDDLALHLEVGRGAIVVGKNGEELHWHDRRHVVERLDHRFVRNCGARHPIQV